MKVRMTDSARLPPPSRAMLDRFGDPPWWADEARWTQQDERDRFVSLKFASLEAGIMRFVDAFERAGRAMSRATASFRAFRLAAEDVSDE